MEHTKLEFYWNDIPIGKNNAITYQELISLWGKNERVVRLILHELSAFDNGDNYILVRSSKSKGFYRSDDEKEITEYKQECLNKGRSVFAPVNKINRVLYGNKIQFSIENNLRLFRENSGMKQNEVCKTMKLYDVTFDVSMLSKMENGVCLPTPYQLLLLAKIYGCKPSELLTADLFI